LPHLTTYRRLSFLEDPMSLGTVAGSLGASAITGASSFAIAAITDAGSLGAIASRVTGYLEASAITGTRSFAIAAITDAGSMGAIASRVAGYLGASAITGTSSFAVTAITDAGSLAVSRHGRNRQKASNYQSRQYSYILHVYKPPVWDDFRVILKLPIASNDTKNPSRTRVELQPSRQRLRSFLSVQKTL
jgi:hypothetical protein